MSSLTWKTAILEMLETSNRQRNAFNPSPKGFATNFGNLAREYLGF
jgi:hypothetical protein